MSDARPIKVFIRNLSGEYLACHGEEWRFAAGREVAHVFDYHADDVPKQLEAAQRNLGVVWIAYPVDSSLVCETCVKCGRKLFPTEAHFNGSDSYCTACHQAVADQ